MVEGQKRVKPAEYFMATAQTTSNNPAINKDTHAIIQPPEEFVY
jgi:hypothetical protein